jgi:hypothetical protein
MQEKSGDFFVYAGMVIDSERALGLSKRIEKIRSYSFPVQSSAWLAARCLARYGGRC